MKYNDIILISFAYTKDFYSHKDRIYEIECKYFFFPFKSYTKDSY